MAVVEQLIRLEEDGTISFGNHELSEKAKVENFEANGSLWKVKTFSGMTKLEKNDMFAYESVPGTSVLHFNETEMGVEFTVSGSEDAQLTIGLLEDTEYRVLVDEENAGRMKTNMGGKLNISVEMNGSKEVSVKITK